MDPASPKLMHPRQSFETRIPVFPKDVYSINNFSFSKKQIHANLSRFNLFLNDDLDKFIMENESVFV